jgi:hypothetical protein
MWVSCEQNEQNEATQLTVKPGHKHQNQDCGGDASKNLCPPGSWSKNPNGHADA